MANESSAVSSTRRGTPRFSEEELRGYNYLRTFIKKLKVHRGIESSKNRELHFDNYIALLLFYFYNPVITSLRGIQQASELKTVQKKLGIKRTSLGSLSEASHVFDAQTLAPLIKELAAQAAPYEKDQRLKKIEKHLIAVDGTLLEALPKMMWALWIDDEHRAIKLHLELSLEHELPTHVEITEGKGNERAELRKMLAPDKLYVLDAGYADYSLFQEIIDIKSSFVVRLRDNAAWQIVQERELRQQDRNAGVQKDMIVHLGSAHHKKKLNQAVRVIEIFHAGDSTRPRRSKVTIKKGLRNKPVDYTFLLVTDLLDVDAEVIALLFRYRWKIELFFRWLKCILGLKHLLALSENGVALQVYNALIASMLITLWTGCKPNKRLFEMLCFYFSDWASLDEVYEKIAKLKASQEKK
jgi:hypothetical protein